MPQPESGTARVIRALIPYSSVVLVVAMIYAGWTLWSRHAATQRVEQEQKAAEASRDAAVTRMLGDGGLKILSFYASPAIVRRGEKALICYGVSNAKSVRIEPHIDDLKPSLGRCLEIHPHADTEYKLTAADGAGHQAQQSFVLKVSK